MKRTFIFSGIIAGLIVSILGAGILSSNQTFAVSAADFNPGRIIDDAIFYDKDGMGNVGDIQSFINSKTPACDTWGTQPSGYQGLTRAQYAVQIKKWHGPPYACLQNYHENLTTGETSFEKGGGAFAGGVSAAQIIYDAAQQYSINPKVLIVLLRKESAGPLFADSWPLKSQYTYAMGYGCPDSGPGYSANCSASQGGFYKQVQKAAWQLRQYYNNISQYNYQPGRTNRIQYSPTPSCGTQDVYIENYATASLYIYTPYVPNAAALNAYPGEAHCGAYGNRNFFMFYNEWFGSTLLNSNFLRTADNSTVYFVSDGVKYPVSDGRLIDAAKPLGGVGFVSQSHLNSLTTGKSFGRLLRGPDGTIYFFDSGIKLFFTSCGMVSAYGYDCGDAVQLNQAQINTLARGPQMISGYQTTEGKRFYIVDGQRREVYDDASLTENSLSKSYNVLTETAISYLPYGTPIIREGVFVKSRSDPGSSYAHFSGVIHKFAKNGVYDKQIDSISANKLDAQSIAKKATGSLTIGSHIKDSSGKSYLITADGKKLLKNSSDAYGIPVTLTSQILNAIGGTGSLTSPIIFKSPNDATVYGLINGQKRPFVSMNDLQSVTGESNPYVAVLGDGYVSSVPTGNIIVGEGRLVKSPSSATVYMTDGYDTLIPMSSFNPAIDLGISLSIRVISDSILQKYTIDNDARLSSYVSCSGKSYLGMGGKAYSLNMGTSGLSLRNTTCNVISKAENPPRFVHGADGTIYERINLTLHPISSMNRYNQLVNQGGGELVKATQSTVSLFTIGAMK